MTDVNGVILKIIVYAGDQLVGGINHASKVVFVFRIVKRLTKVTLVFMQNFYYCGINGTTIVLRNVLHRNFKAE